MRTVLRNKSRILLFALLAAVFFFSNGSEAQFTKSSPVNRSTKSDVNEPAAKPIDEAAQLQAALSSPETATVLVELDSDSLVVHQRKMVGAEGADHKINLEEPDAKVYESQLQIEQENFKSLARKLSPNMRVIVEVRTLLNMISIEAPGTELASIATLPGIKRVALRKQYKADLNASLPLINTSAAWTKLGGSNVAGQGIKVAILDTGIDISNPLFAPAGFTAPPGFPKGDVSFTNNKVIAAKAFGLATAADQNGHGTNVAGIAAGNLNTTSPLAPISGVAPKAFLGNYRVLDSFGNGTDDFIIQALQAAVTDHFDVANMSLGGTATPTLGLLDQAVENAVAAGMTVVAAAGNSGEARAGTIESPGIAPSAIAVGSSSNSHVVGPGAHVTVTGGPAELTNIGATVAQGGAPSSALSGSIGPLVYVDADPGNRGCSGLPAGSLSGKIALIERGNGCSFATKVNTASSAGATAVVIYNRSISESADGGDTMFIMDVSGPPQATIPSVFVTRTSGLALKDWVTGHAGAQVTLAPVPLIDLSNPADVISVFSSRGPSSLKALKPDLVAPGEPVYSGAITTNNPDGVSDPSGFASVSGTSQAAPHVAGG